MYYILLDRLCVQRTVGAWLQLEEPHQGSWIRMQNPMDAKHLWIVEKKRTVPSDLPFSPDRMQQYVIRDTVSKIKLLEDERASLARDTVRFQRGLEAVHKTIDMPKNGNTSPYNIRDALDATSKAINALKAGDAVTLEPVTLDSDIDTSEEAEADLFLNSIGVCG